MLLLLLCAALAPAPADAPVSPDHAINGDQQANEAPTAPPLNSPAATPTTIELPALTGVELVIVDEVTSKTAISGMPVQLRLSRPVYVTSEAGIAAGTQVEGVVIHAAKGGMGGKSGELLIGAKRIILSETVSVPLRSFRLGPAKGQNNEGVAMGVAIAGGAIGGVASMFITGGSAKVPAGTVANAKTQAAAEIPVSLLTRLPMREAIAVAPAPAVPGPNSQSEITKGETK